MRYLFCLIFTAAVLSNSFSQTKMESEMDAAYQNAKKGIYWALNNIPEKKDRLDKDLVFEDKLCASVKLSKEVDGVKIESRGVNSSYEVSVTIYKSYEFLVKEGYIKLSYLKDLIEQQE